MKNSKKIKIISICVILLITSFVAIGFYAKSKFNPESLKSELITNLSELYPNLTIELDNLEVDFGINSHIKISNIRLISKLHGPESSKLANFELIDVKIPVFNILTGGGTIVLDIKKPNIVYRAIEKETNWSKVFDAPEKKSTKTDSEKTKLPSFLANSQLNAQMENLELIHMNSEGISNKYFFNEISLRDIGLKRPMAIKLNSEIEFNKTEKIKFSLSSIGEFSLKSFIENKVIRTKSISKVSNLTISEKKIEIEEVSLNTNLLFRNDKTGRISFEINAGSLLESTGEYLILKDEGTLKLEKFLISLTELNKHYPFKPENFELNDSSLSLEGEVNILKEGKINPFLKAKTTKPLFYKTEMFDLEIQRGLLVLSENKVELTSAFSLLKGKGELKLSNEFDLNKKIDLAGIEPFAASIELNGLIIEESLIKMAMKPSDKKPEVIKEETPIIPFILDLNLKNIILMKEVLNGKGQISAVKEKVSVKNLDIKVAGGNVFSNITTSLLRDKTTHNFSIDIDKLDLSKFKGIAPKDMPFLTGILKGSIAGKAEASKNKLTYSAFVKGEARSGEIVNYDFSETVNIQLNKINQLPYFNKKPLKLIKLPQDYEKLTYDLHLKHNDVKIKKIHLIGIKKKIELKSEGHLKDKGDSEVYVNFFDKKRNYLKFLKEFNMTSFPTRMSGQGYELSPDYNYTKRIFINKTKKKLKKKAKTAAKKIIKKETKKLEQKVKSKAKDLLKDIFQ